MKRRLGKCCWWLGFRLTYHGARFLGWGARLQQSVPHAAALQTYAEMNALATICLELALSEQRPNRSELH